MWKRPGKPREDFPPCPARIGQMADSNATASSSTNDAPAFRFSPSPAIVHFLALLNDAGTASPAEKKNSPKPAKKNFLSYASPALQTEFQAFSTRYSSSSPPYVTFEEISLLSRLYQEIQSKTAIPSEKFIQWRNQNIISTNNKKNQSTMKKESTISGSSQSKPEKEKEIAAATAADAVDATGKKEKENSSKSSKSSASSSSSPTPSAFVFSSSLSSFSVSSSFSSLYSADEISHQLTNSRLATSALLKTHWAHQLKQPAYYGEKNENISISSSSSSPDDFHGFFYEFLDRAVLLEETEKSKSPAAPRVRSKEFLAFLERQRIKQDRREYAELVQDLPGNKELLEEFHRSPEDFSAPGPGNFSTEIKSAQRDLGYGINIISLMITGFVVFYYIGRQLSPGGGGEGENNIFHQIFPILCGLFGLIAALGLEVVLFLIREKKKELFYKKSRAGLLDNHPLIEKKSPIFSPGEAEERRQAAIRQRMMEYQKQLEENQMEGKSLTEGEEEEENPVKSPSSGKSSSSSSLSVLSKKQRRKQQKERKQEEEEEEMGEKQEISHNLEKLD